jgi:type II secretory pathway component GspD/PulD (secretin)
MNTTQIRRTFLTVALAVLPLGLSASAQDQPVKDKPSIAHTTTIYLANTPAQNDANEIVTAVRSIIDPSMKVYFIASQNAIVISGPPDQIALAEKIVKDLDRPHKLYRLTYTLAEYDNGKSVGTQHVSMVVATGQRVSLKQGDKIPVATGSYGPGGTVAGSIETQFTYLDVGMNFDATLDEVEGGAHLKTKVEQSGVSQSNTIAGVQEPVVRQSVIETIAVLTLGKPLMLGSVDIPDSTRHLDIDVVVEQVK